VHRFLFKPVGPGPNLTPCLRVQVHPKSHDLARALVCNRTWLAAPFPLPPRLSSPRLLSALLLRQQWIPTSVVDDLATKAVVTESRGEKGSEESGVGKEAPTITRTVAGERETASSSSVSQPAAAEEPVGLVEGAAFSDPSQPCPSRRRPDLAVRRSTATAHS
jgi:hypothetical protein